MRSISIQVQPDRAPDINITQISEEFQKILSRDDLVLKHSFTNGFDNGQYYNFTFGTEQPSKLWNYIEEVIFNNPNIATNMALSSMAMCSNEDGWDNYVQLYHWDKQVPIVPSSSL